MTTADSKTEIGETLPVCGLVMPISGFQLYTTSYWSEVRDIIERAIVNANMQPRPVWESADSDIIHSRIVRNLYSDKLIVCDASGLNPNVMFELGMRLTFKKPTIIVVDDTTKLPFDTSSIEHIQYPTDLHFGKTEIFMNLLTKKILSILKSHGDGTYKPYLDTFGAFTVVEPEADSIKFDQFVVEQLRTMSTQISAIRRDQNRTMTLSEQGDVRIININTEKLRSELADDANTVGWSPERISILKEMWKNGSTASQIAETLGGNISRNAIIGRAHRLGLESRPSPIREDF